MASFELGGVVVPIEAGDGTISQTYAPKNEGTLLYLGNGSSIKQIVAGFIGKLKTTITSSSVWTPASFAGLDFSDKLLLKCAQHRSVGGNTVVIDISPKRRTDSGYTPRGYGLVNGVLVETGIDTIVGDTVTLFPVVGATSYKVDYWPEIEVFATFNENMNARASQFGWSLVCEEV